MATERCQDGTDSPSECRALVVLETPGRPRADDRPLADFVTQLIACHRRLPAYRTAGRIQAADARSSYQPPDAPVRGCLDLVV